jgi:hypothetical protein
LNVKSIFVTVFIFIVIVLSGCSEEKEAAPWKVSDPFEHDGMTMHGTKGKFGVIKVNGESDEPAFPVGEGRHYELHFLGDSSGLNGKTYNMTATHKDSEESVFLYESVIDNNRSGAKFVLESEGLWKIDVSVDEEPLTSFVVEAE